MTDTTWDEVGHQFAELGRELQRAWQKGRVDDQTKRQLKDSGDKVKAALDDLAAKINRTADAPDVREATKNATTGLADALASTLREVAAWLDRPSHDRGADRRDESD